IDPDLDWDDIEDFAATSPLPVIVKGILTPEDALLAAEHGARSIVVSNHGGRQLDTVLAGADALPPIVDAVGDRLEVIVDGGIRRGTDVVKALALGARAVMVGRPALWGLAVGGAEGAGRWAPPPRELKGRPAPGRRRECGAKHRDRRRRRPRRRTRPRAEWNRRRLLPDPLDGAVDGRTVQRAGAPGGVEFRLRRA